MFRSILETAIDMMRALRRHYCEMTAEGTDTRSAESDKGFLLQNDLIENVLPKIGKKEWQTLFSKSDSHYENQIWWCALLHPEAVDESINRDTWDINIGDGMPGFQGYPPENAVYSRFGGSDIVRPLVLSRSFHETFPQYFELDEEFRLYHNLAEDRNRGLLLSFDDSNQEIEVVRIKKQQICARLKYLRQFQAGTGLYLAFYLKSGRYSQIRLDDVPENDRKLVNIEKFENCFVRRTRRIFKCDNKEGFDTFSILLCKVILKPHVDSADT